VSEFLEARLKAGKLSPEQEHHIKVTLNGLDGFKEEQMAEVIVKYGIKAPETGNELTYPEPFNLMLPTSVGPSTKISSFLRPETA
jgi:glycyl-tRNA synthetase